MEIHCFVFILHWTWAKSLSAFHRFILTYPFSTFKLILICFKVNTYLCDTLGTHDPLLCQLHQHLRVKFLLFTIFSYFPFIFILKRSLFLLIFNKKSPNTLTNFAAWMTLNYWNSKTTLLSYLKLMSHDTSNLG